MDKSILESLRELNILIKRKLFLILKENGINEAPNPLQVSIFMYLYNNKNKEVSQADLVKELHVSKVAISEAIAKMVSNGNIEVIASKTDQGIKRTKNMIKSLSLLNNELLRDIDEFELNTFMNVMQCMKKNIEEEKNV